MTVWRYLETGSESLLDLASAGAPGHTAIVFEAARDPDQGLILSNGNCCFVQGVIQTGTEMGT